jgi:peptidoglycan/xylan/chitin deacetylase (PgdA/CDA1 family)
VSLLHRLARLPLRLLAVIVLITPFLLATRLLATVNPFSLGVQYDPPDPSITAAELASWQRIGADLPATAAPVVLAFHDVRPNSPDQYVVSPLQLDRMLAAFTAAGYHTLTTGQFVAYLQGGPAPPRGIYLTFDDGTQGLYEYADPILARNHMTAASFLITGRVGHNQPYYLSWPEIHQMAASGRWDFQAHTHDLHTRGEVGPGKLFGSLLTGSSWPTPTRMETVTEHQQRIGADLDLMFTDFADHGLPRPLVFAYPFSEADTSYDQAAVEATDAIVHDRFTVALTNKTSVPTPASRRDEAGRVVERLEVFGMTQPADLLAQVAAWTSIAPDVANPLADAGRWWDDAIRGVPRLGALIGQPDPSILPGDTYLAAWYAPYATADWMGYTVTTQVRGLRREGNNANVIVRAGGQGEAEIRTSCCGVQIVDGATGAVLSQQRLVAAENHRVRIDVTDGGLSVTVDGDIAVSLRVGTGPAYTGGIAIASRKANSAGWPYFASMSIVEDQ